MTDEHTYIDAIFSISTNNKSEIYYDADAIVLAIKNLMLSRPGNYPEMPSFGINIQKYEFAKLDDITLSNIKSEISYQINKYLPSINTTNIDVIKIEKDNEFDYNGIGISISVTVSGSISDLRYVVLQDHENINVAVEVL